MKFFHLFRQNKRNACGISIAADVYGNGDNTFTIKYGTAICLPVEKHFSRIAGRSLAEGRLKFMKVKQSVCPDDNTPAFSGVMKTPSLKGLKYRVLENFCMRQECPSWLTELIRKETDKIEEKLERVPYEK